MGARRRAEGARENKQDARRTERAKCAQHEQAGEGTSRHEQEGAGRSRPGQTTGQSGCGRKRLFCGWLAPARSLAARPPPSGAPSSDQVLAQLPCQPFLRPAARAMHARTEDDVCVQWITACAVHNNTCKTTRLLRRICRRGSSALAARKRCVLCGLVLLYPAVLLC